MYSGPTTVDVTLDFRESTNKTPAKSVRNQCRDLCITLLPGTLVCLFRIGIVILRTRLYVKIIDMYFVLGKTLNIFGSSLRHTIAPSRLPRAGAPSAATVASGAVRHGGAGYSRRPFDGGTLP